MSEQTSETPVEVTVEVTVPEPVEETPEVSAVVVVEAEPEPTAEVVVETAIDHEGRLATLEARITAIEQTATEALIVAETAQIIATQEPEPEIEVAPEPEPEDTAPVEPDVQPDNEHWLYKKKGWFGF